MLEPLGLMDNSHTPAPRVGRPIGVELLGLMVFPGNPE